jgi:ribose transport system ATP-binding protein
LIARNETHRRTLELLREVGLDVSPRRLVGSLSAGERQLVEIAKALSIDARLVIFDEPTTSLGVRETDRLFTLIEALRSRGLAIIYISHALADVFRLCDEIVVLRDGEVVGAGTAGQFSTDRLVSLMVGRSIGQLFPPRVTEGGFQCRSDRQATPPAFEASGVSQPGIVDKVSLVVSRGEVLGLFGLMGAGRSELARILFGLDPLAAGEVRLNGDSVSGLTPRERIKRGIAFVTENRHREGLLLDAAVGENLVLVNLQAYSRPPLLGLVFDKVEAAVRRVRAVVKLDFKARDAQPVRTLSGGNQQKVVLGKWLLGEPKVLILDEPTRGIDVGAKQEIYKLIGELADRGTGVMVISSDVEELIGLCDRILVMRRGCLVDELSRAEFDRERVLRAALGTGGGG